MILNGNFKANFKKDVERTLKNEKIYKRYGAPLQDLNLKKGRAKVIWFLPWFIIIRIVFVSASILLWNRPLTLLTVRMFSAMTSFVVIKYV